MKSFINFVHRVSKTRYLCHRCELFESYNFHMCHVSIHQLITVGAIFNWIFKVILVCFCFSSLHNVIGSENSRQPFMQPIRFKPKSIGTWLPAFSRALNGLFFFGFLKYFPSLNTQLKCALFQINLTRNHFHRKNDIPHRLPMSTKVFFWVTMWRRPTAP